MRLSKVVCYRFKNHGETAVPLTGRTAVCGPNGSGKTNFLEAAYFALNAAVPPGRRATELAQGFSGEFFVRTGIVGPSGFEEEFSISCDVSDKKVAYACQGSPIDRKKYLERMGLRATLFSPIEMNVLYLGPELRRAFMDEPASLSGTEFHSMKKSYGDALKNRNILLKRIAEGTSKSDHLDVWDPLFAREAAAYVAVRRAFANYVTERMETVESFLDAKYPLRFSYLTRSDSTDPEGEILEYLKKNRTRDIAVGHTLTGPHLDDFSVSVLLPSGPVRSEHYLSRGENKSVLYALKLLSTDYLDTLHARPTVLLFDDPFSELDRHRAEILLKRAAGREFILAGQSVPKDLSDAFGMGRFDLSENG